MAPIRKPTLGTILDGPLSWPRLRAHWPAAVHPRTKPWDDIERQAEVAERLRAIEQNHPCSAVLGGGALVEQVESPKRTVFTVMPGPGLEPGFHCWKGVD